MAYNVTIFEAQERGKIPISPFGDRTFIFRTRELNTHYEFLSTIGKYFMLNQPFKNAGNEHDFRDFRRVSVLKEKYSDLVPYIILDIDDVSSKEDMQYVINYFKEYKVILGESYSHNGIDNFRLKGVLFCVPSTHEQIKSSLERIADDLKNHCNIDTSRGHIPSFNAPSNKNKPVFNNENGILWEAGELLSIRAVENTLTVKKSNLSDIDKRVKQKTETTIWKPRDFQEADSVEDICLMYFDNLGFEAMEPVSKDGEEFIIFKHDTEVKTPGGFSWNKNNPYIMNHWNANRTVDGFQEIHKIPRVKELIKESLDYNSELLSYNPKTTLLKVNEKFLKITNEIEEAIEQFIESDSGIFSIRSPMGTGKSTVIRGIIEHAHDYGLRVLIITNRISVAEDFGDKYEIKLYNSDTGDQYQRGESLICQFDSLWKYDIKDFDLVVMDEFISLMAHSRSDLNNSSFNLVKFFAAFQKKLVIADAFLTGYERFLLSSAVDRNSFLLDNEYRDNTTVYDYDDKNQFVLKLLHTAREHRVTVSSTSLRFLEDVRSLLNDNGLRTVSLTADTPDHTKELIYETFKGEHDKYDVLLYSPTLTVGVSILTDIGYHFHYDGSNSADVISSIQMIKRNRKAKEIHLHVRDMFKYLVTDYQRLRRQYLDNVGKLGDFSVIFEVNEYGDIQVSEIGKKVLKIDIFKNILETNHKGAMMWLMKYHFKNSPRHITRKFGSNILSRYSKENRQNSKNIQNELIQEFLNLSDISQVEANNSNNSTINKIADAHEALDLQKVDKLSNAVEIKEEFLKLALSNSSFIRECQNFKLMKAFLKGELNETDIRYKMQKYISSSDIEVVKFCNAILRMPVKFSYEYEIREEQNRYTRLVLNNSGYKKKSRVGHRFLAVPNNIKKFSEYVQEL